MRIGELAERTGVSRRLLRYYKEQALIVPTRGANGYREYGEPLRTEQARLSEQVACLTRNRDAIAGYLDKVLRVK